eukprot:569840-Prorocentrum_minimum.AAC.2
MADPNALPRLQHVSAPYLTPYLTPYSEGDRHAMADPNAPPRLQHVSAPQPVNIAFTSRVLSASLPLLAQEDP